MNKREMVPKTLEELGRNFKDIFDFLQSSCEMYDAGRKSEAVRLAGIVHILVYDKGQRSLLSQMGRRDTMLFKNTALAIRNENILHQSCLTEVAPGSTGMEYRPPLSRGIQERYSQPDQAFEDWWTTAILMEGLTEETRANERRQRTRKDLVLHFRDKEGGGHVDGRIERLFADLKRNPNYMAEGSFVVEREGGTEQRVFPERGPEYASMRQIAYEIEQSLRTYCADLLS